ncbi:MAG: hypothetical protein ABSC42_01795 [Tepidisphaeraceae bacterium]
MQKKKLNHEDAQAVDLFLDRQAANPSDSGVFVKFADPQPQRMQKVKHILNLLKELPVEDPSPDLAGRTVRRVVDTLSSPDGSTILRSVPGNRPGNQQPLS